MRIVMTSSLVALYLLAMSACTSAPAVNDGDVARKAQPDNQPAKQPKKAQPKKAQPKKAQPQKPAGPPKLPDDLQSLDDEAADLTVRMQRASVEIDRAVEDSLQLYRQKKFDQAAKMLTRASELLRWMEIKRPGQAERAERVAELLVQVRKDGVEYKRQQEIKRLTEMKRQRRAAEMQRSRRVRERVVRLVREADFNFRREAYDDAATLYREALRLDPTNRDLTAKMELARVAHHRKVRDILKRNLVRQTIATRLRTDVAALPQHTITLYPPEEVWREITKRQTTASSMDVDKFEPEIVKIREKLKKRISVDFSETPLTDVVQFLRETLGVNMVVDPQLLRDRSPDELTVDMKLTDVEATSALKLMCDLRSLRYGIRNGVVFITGAE